MPPRRHHPTLLLAGALSLAAVLSACEAKPEALLGSARQYLEKNDYKAAIIQIKNALQANPELPQARLLLGTALLESGDAVGAETELRHALALHHPLDAVLPPLAQSLLAQRKEARLIEEFGKATLSQAQARADLQLSLYRAYGLQEQPAQAQAALQAAVQAAPDYPPVLLAQAQQRAVQQDHAGAQALLDTLLARSARHAEAWKLKGDLYAMAQDKPQDAVAAYRKAVEYKPDYLLAHSALVMLLMRQGDPAGASQQWDQLQKVAPAHPYTQYLGAMLAFDRKDFKSANSLVQQALASQPDNSAALQLAGATALELRQWPQAQDYLSRALEHSPGLPLARRLLVTTYLRLQQPARALEVLQPALKAPITDPHLVPLAGEVYLRNGDTAKAERYLKQARDQSPGDGRLRTSVALVEMLRTPNSEGNLDALRQISASDKGVSADLALINRLIERRALDKALDAIAVLEKKQPDKALAPFLRGRVLMLQNKNASARSSLERAQALQPDYFAAVAGLASLDMQEKKPAEARKRFEAVLRRDPNNLSALLALAELAASTGAPHSEVLRLLGNAVNANPNDAGARVLLINAHLGNHDARAALAAAQQAAAALPQDARVLDALGRSQLAAGENQQALKTFEKLADLMPGSHLPYWQLANAQLAAQDKPAAAQSLQKALKLQPDFLDGQRGLIALYLDDKRTADALGVARTVQKQRPKEAAGYVLEADIQAQGSHWDAAVAALRSGLQQSNASLLAARLHTALQSGGKQAQAEQFAAQWQQQHPKDVAFSFYLGDQALTRKDFAVAERQYSAVLKQQANNAMALNNLAWVGARLQRPEALGYAEKAVALAPNQPAFLDTLAGLHLERGNYAQALDLQTRALQLQPQNHQLKLNLARIQLRAGKKDQAQKTLDELSQLGSGFAVQAEVAALRKELAQP